MTKILVVDDEVGIRELLSEILRDEGYDVALAENAATARALRNALQPDLVLLDIWMPDTDGITLLKEWSAGGQLTMPVVMMSGHGTIDTAVEATRIGAQDFLEKPIALQKLLAAVRRALELEKSAAPVRRHELSLAAFSQSAALTRLKRRVEQMAARTRALMLDCGAGTLAELCARTLHEAEQEWLDLSQLGEPLTLEMLEKAAGGVLFIEELARLNRLQQKNLSFAFERLERFQLRLVVASEWSVEELLEQGFEDALLRALMPARLGVPGLLELRDEVPDMASRILDHFIDAQAMPARRLSTAALNALRKQEWRGGYAALRSTVHSLALGALEEEIDAEEVARLARSQLRLNEHASLPLDLPLREAREAFERFYFEYHLRKEDGNVGRLAERAGLERTNLYRKLRQLGVQLGQKDQPA